MYEKIRNYVNEYKMLEGCTQIVLGLSGGADSICLLHVLSQLSKELEIPLKAVHIHHGLRGADADADRDLCRLQCQNMNVELKEYYYDVKDYSIKQGISTEEAGRILRYKAFAKELIKGGRIAVAHHMNDQAETVIFNMCRGSGLKGIRGMLPVRGNIIRPLLCCDRQDILQYIQEEHLEYCVDVSNESDEYTRNRIRHHIIPVLEKGVNERTVKNIGNLSEGIADVEAYIERQAKELYRKCRKVEPEGILICDMEKQDPFIQKHIIIKAINEMSDGLKDIGRVHIDRVCSLISANSGTRITIRKGLVAEKTQDGIYFTFEITTCKMDSIYVEIPSKVEIGNEGEFVEFQVIEWGEDKKIPKEVYTKCFDYDKIKSTLQLRRRQTGDYLIIDESGHKKKLKQYFIDEKIPRRKREELILLAENNHVLWVLGERISAYYKVTDTTRKVLKVNYGGTINGKN